MWVSYAQWMDERPVGALEWVAVVVAGLLFLVAPVVVLYLGAASGRS